VTCGFGRDPKFSLPCAARILDWTGYLHCCTVADMTGAVVVGLGVLLKIAYLLTCWMLGLAVLVFRSDRAKDVELLVLRHKNAVLRRNAGRVQYEPGDRVRWCVIANQTSLSRSTPSSRPPAPGSCARPQAPR
jgi:hypothetical protein